MTAEQKRAEKWTLGGAAEMGAGGSLVCAELEWRVKVRGLQTTALCFLNFPEAWCRKKLESSDQWELITRPSFNSFNSQFPSCSLSSLCLRASSFIIRASSGGAIREELTRLPASLSRLQPHQNHSLPAASRMEVHYGRRGLACCEIFIDATLSPRECALTCSHTDTHLQAE